MWVTPKIAQEKKGPPQLSHQRNKKITNQYHKDNQYTEYNVFINQEGPFSSVLY
jgi:hypothetical protein